MGRSRMRLRTRGPALSGGYGGGVRDTRGRRGQTDEGRPPSRRPPAEAGMDRARLPCPAPGVAGPSAGSGKPPRATVDRAVPPPASGHPTHATTELLARRLTPVRRYVHAPALDRRSHEARLPTGRVNLPSASSRAQSSAHRGNVVRLPLSAQQAATQPIDAARMCAGRRRMQTIAVGPLVSVVIPTHDRRDVLPEAIDSVLAQTYQNFETVVADDGSTDDTRAVLADYGDRIRLLVRSSSGGPSAARNSAIRHSTRELILLLDDDDFCLPNRLGWRSSSRPASWNVVLYTPLC